MQGYFKRVVEKVIDWGVPVVCAAALLLWEEIPNNLHHYWPVICLAVMGIYSLIMSIQTRREVVRLRKIHEESDLKAVKLQARDDSIAKAFRAMLDDDMGNLYAACMSKGYTTEDERRRYARLNSAYEAVHGNGEAKRRHDRFEKIPDENEWKAQQNRQD